MRHLSMLALTYAAFVLDASGSELFSGPFRPSFLLLAALAALAMLDDWTAIVWAAADGLLSDGLGSGPVGPAMFSTVAIAWLLRRTTRFGPGEPVWLLSLFGLPALLGLHLGPQIIHSLLDGSLSTFAQHLPESLQTVVGTALTGLTLAALVRLIARKLPNRHPSTRHQNRWRMLT